MDSYNPLASFLVANVYIIIFYMIWKWWWYRRNSELAEEEKNNSFRGQPTTNFFLWFIAVTLFSILWIFAMKINS